MARWRRHDSLPTDCRGRRSSLIFEPTRVKKDPRSFFKGRALAFYKPMGAVRMCRCLRRWSCCMWHAWPIFVEAYSRLEPTRPCPWISRWPPSLNSIPSAGFLQTDGGSSYVPVFKALELLHVACMAHIRRGIFEARADAPLAVDLLLTAIRSSSALNTG